MVGKKAAADGKQFSLSLVFKSGMYEVELGWALTWRKYSWRSA